MATAIHSRNTLTGRPTLGALVSAVMLRCGSNDPSRERGTYDAPRGGLRRIAYSAGTVRDADDGALLRGRPILDLARMAAELDGVRFSSTDPAPVLSVLYSGSHQQRGMSTGTLGALFSDTFASQFLASYDQGGDSTTGWCAETENLNLKRAARIMLGAPRLSLQPRGGEAEHLNFEAASEDTQLGCYTGQFKIDEQDFLDDTATVLLTDVPGQLGNAARALRPDLVYSCLARNPALSDGVALFHADHANLETGAALADAKVTAAMAAIAKQQHNGVPLNLRGQYFVVPQALERTAAKLARDVELKDPDAMRAPVVRSDSRLDNGLTDPTDPADPTGATIHAGSATTWYMSTAGQQGIEVQYLAGTNKAPEIRNGFLTRGSFGVWFDVRHFIGVKAVDYRGLVRNDA